MKDEESVFFDAEKMISHLLEDNKEYAARMRKAHEVCHKYDDVATASILEIFIDETERRTWFLFETQAEK